MLTYQTFNRKTSGKIFAPRRHRIKIRISKLEISNKLKYSNPKIEIQNDLGKHPKKNEIQIRNSNIEIRNNFKISILKIQNLPMRTSPVFLNVLKLVFWVFPFCFEFRISCFEFCFPFVSDFEFRTCIFNHNWRSSLRYGAFLRVGETHRELW